MAIQVSINFFLGLRIRVNSSWYQKYFVVNVTTLSLFNENCADSEIGLHCLHECDKVLIDCLDACFTADCQVQVHLNISFTWIGLFSAGKTKRNALTAVRVWATALKVNISIGPKLLVLMVILGCENCQSVYCKCGSPDDNPDFLICQEYYEEIFHV